MFGRSSTVSPKQNQEAIDKLEMQPGIKYRNEMNIIHNDGDSAGSCKGREV